MMRKSRRRFHLVRDDVARLLLVSRAGSRREASVRQATTSASAIMTGTPRVDALSLDMACQKLRHTDVPIQDGFYSIDRGGAGGPLRALFRVSGEASIFEYSTSEKGWVRDASKPGPYRTLCEWAQANGGRIRLGRAGENFMLVVEAPDLGTSTRMRCSSLPGSRTTTRLDKRAATKRPTDHSSTPT